MNEWKSLAEEIQKDSVRSAKKSGYEKDKADYLLRQKTASDKSKKERHYRELQKKLKIQFRQEKVDSAKAVAHRVSVPIVKVGGFFGRRLKSEWRHRKKMRKERIRRHDSLLKPMHPLGS